MKLLIVAGGGGHFAPALSVIESLPKDWEVLLVGRKYSLEGDSALSLEYQTAEKMNIPFRSLTTGRIQRKLTRHSLSSILKTPIGMAQAFNTLRDYKPNVVLSFGGYVAVPVVIAAHFLKIPVVIHEQTFGAGLANKVSAKFADKICISWDTSRKYFPKEKVVLTGNPIRKYQESSIEYKVSDQNVPLIYITGGSAGAHGINLFVEGCLGDLLESFNIIHQTGDAREFEDFKRLENLKKRLSPDLQKRYFLTKFIDPQEVSGIMKKADLVISRSGINTVTEILYFGKPSILIPLPYGQENEQSTNARFVEDLGLGLVAEQENLDNEKFLGIIRMVINNLDKYKKAAEKSKSLIKENASDKIIDVIKNAG